MIKHIVFWKISPPGDREAHMKIVEEFGKKTAYLKTIIPEIVDAVVGHNFVEGDVFNICIDATFQSQEDLDAYINHPEHLKVREYMNSVTYDKAVFDYRY